MSIIVILDNGYNFLCLFRRFLGFFFGSRISFVKRYELNEDKCGLKLYNCKFVGFVVVGVVGLCMFCFILFGDMVNRYRRLYLLF